jgi:DNA end-binding protein Ku
VSGLAFILRPLRRSGSRSGRSTGAPAIGHRIRHKLVDSVTGEAVDKSDKARGYEVGEDEFVLVEDPDLERARSARPPPGSVELVEPLRRESPPTVRAERHEPEAGEVAAAMTRKRRRSLRSRALDARYLEKPYYIVPHEEIGQESFAVIRDAMSREGLIGLPASCCRRAKRPFPLEPVGYGMGGVERSD